VAVAMLMRLPGVRLEEYDRLIADCGLDADPAVGQILHVSVETAEDVETWDVWQTRETATAFIEKRLKPALRTHGISVDPDVRLYPLHNLFAPDIETIERIGAFSSPAVADSSRY
jgi:hypothetical protein